MKKVNKKNNDFLMKICGFWIDFEADFKPSILKQDKADQCHKAHTKGDDRLYRKGRYHQATDFGGAGRTYSAFGCRRPICSAVERAGKVLCVACSSTTMPLPSKTKK